MKKLSLMIALILLIPTIKPLLRPGFFTMHDDQQIVRLAQMDQALKSGQFPVRWVADLGFGYGYPLFNFYPPLVYYLGEIFYLFLGISYIQAMKLVFATSFVGAALSMYLWANHHWGQVPAVVAALFYSYAPYRAVDAYVRGALAEAFSFVWLPLILLAMDRLAEIKENDFRRKPALWMILLSLSYAGLMITHNLIVLPFTLLMFGYWLLKLLSVKRNSFVVYTAKLTVSGVLAIALSAFFWVPALAEMQFTLVDTILLAERYDHSLHYVEPFQLWNSLWGYGGSTAGVLDGFSLKIGKLHLVVVGFVLIINVLMYLSKVDYLREKRNLLFSCISLFFFSAWMTTAYSSLIWDYFSPIQFLQFPWRFLTFTTLFSSFIAAGLVWYVVPLIHISAKARFAQALTHRDLKSALLALISRFFAPLTQVFVAISLLVVLFIPNVKLFTPQEFLEVTDSYYTSEEFTKWKISKTSFEFVPSGVKTTTENDLQITQLAINRDQIAVSPYSIIQGDASVSVEANYPHFKNLLVSADSITLLEFNSFNFPGWQLYIDGEETQINQDNDLQLVSTLVPKGTHQVVLVFTNTPVRAVANSVSMMGWVILLGILGYLVIMNRKQSGTIIFQS